MPNDVTLTSTPDGWHSRKDADTLACAKSQAGPDAPPYAVAVHMDRNGPTLTFDLSPEEAKCFAYRLIELASEVEKGQTIIADDINKIASGGKVAEGCNGDDD